MLKRYGKFIIPFFLLVLILGFSYAQLFDPRKTRANNYFKDGFRFFNTERYELATQNFEKAVEADPTFSKGWFFLGKSFLKQGLIENCVDSWQRFLEIGDGDREIRKKIKNLILQEYETQDPDLLYTFEHIGTIDGLRYNGKRFANPTGIAIDQDGNIYLASLSGKKVLKFTSVGRFVLGVGSAEGKRIEPYGVSVNKQQEIFVTDFAGDRVVKFDAHGKFVFSIGSRGGGDGEFLGPEGIALDEDGNIYVVDTGNSRIQKFDKEGNFIMKFGSFGDRPGQFDLPKGICVDKDGNIWVTESGGGRIQRFDSSGNFLSQLKPLERVEFCGIEVWRDNVFVCDARGQVFRYNLKASNWHKIKSWDGGKVRFSTPQDICIGESGAIYVSDYSRHTVEIFIPEEFERKGFDVSAEWVDVRYFPKIHLAVNVTTTSGRALLGLSEENFKVLEDGKRMYPIGIDTPLRRDLNSTLSFVIDTTREMSEYEDTAKELLIGLVEDMEPGLDYGSIILCGEDASVVEKRTPNKDKLLKAISDSTCISQGRGRDVLFKGIYKGITETLGFFGRRAVLITTSGDDLISQSPLIKGCVLYAKSNRVPIFIIDYRPGRETEVFKTIAQKTQGLYIHGFTSRHIKDIYSVLTDHLMQQNLYIISYNSDTRKWTDTWVDVRVGAAYFGLYGEDALGYFVPPAQKRLPKE
jgi:DNA-binding beta-propeller fold protein YncE